MLCSAALTLRERAESDRHETVFFSDVVDAHLDGASSCAATKKFAHCPDGPDPPRGQIVDGHLCRGSDATAGKGHRGGRCYVNEGGGDPTLQDSCRSPERVSNVELDARPVPL